MTDRATRQGALVESADQVHAAASEAKKKAHTALDSLTTLTNSKFDGGAVDAFAKFEAALQTSEAETQTFKTAVGSLSSGATAVFDQWKNDLELYSSPSLRLRSRERLEAARTGYEEIVTAANPAVTGLEALHRAMRDHALFLGNDLTAEAVRSIQGDVSTLGRDLTKIDDQVFQARTAAASYVESHTLPERGETTPNPNNNQHPQ